MKQITHFIFAVRNGNKFEQICNSYHDWTVQSEWLLDNGFMVHIKDDLWGVLDSKGEVRFFKDDTYKVIEPCLG